MLPVHIRFSPYVVLQKLQDEKYLYDLISNHSVKLTRELKELRCACSSPVDTAALTARLSEESVRRYLQAGILADADKVWLTRHIKTIDIEVSSLCNWKCIYCPNSVHTTPKKVMSLEFFGEILQKIVRHGMTRVIALNGYSEPALDPFFAKRIQMIADTGLKISLNTNGSLLDQNKVNLLDTLQVVHHIFFNLPSVEPEEFFRMTGSKKLEQTLCNILYAAEKNESVTVLCQGKAKRQTKNFWKIREYFAPYANIQVLRGDTRDRAGLLKNEFCENTYIPGKLCGCLRPLDFFSVDVDGVCYICGHDFQRETNYGNIQDGEIDQIINSDKAISLRKKIFGETEAEPDFICRRCFDMKTTCINHAYLERAVSEL